MKVLLLAVLAACLMSCANTGAALGELGTSLQVLTDTVNDQSATIGDVVASVESVGAGVESVGAGIQADRNAPEEDGENKLLELGATALLAIIGANAARNRNLPGTTRLAKKA